VLTRVLVALAVVLSGCAAEELEDRYTNKLVSCSVSIPQDWRDKLAANEVTDASANAVRIVAASDDGRATVVQTWSSALELALHTPDGQRRPFVSTRHHLSIVEFDGRRVTYAVQEGGQDTKFFTWDAETAGEPVPVDWKDAERDHERSSDGTTTVWAEKHRLFALRADWPQQRLIAEIQNSPYRVGSISGPQVHGDFVSWFGMDSSYITDIRTGASVHTSDNYVLQVRGGALVLTKPQRTTASTPLSGLSPLPAC
jgi:hypothetical protein